MNVGGNQDRILNMFKIIDMIIIGQKFGLIKINGYEKYKEL